MLNSHTIIIGSLAVILSFALYILGDKYLAETSAFGKEVQYCESSQPSCAYSFADKKAEIMQKYGASYEQLTLDYKRKKLFAAIPFMLLMTALFVGLTIDEKEPVFAALCLCPFLIYFMNKFIYHGEFCLGPVYMVFAVLSTRLFVRLKRRLFLKNP